MLGLLELEALKYSLGFIYLLVYVLAGYNCYRIFVSVRAPIPTIIWILFHIVLPMFAVPLYALVGRRRLSRRRELHRDPDRDGLPDLAASAIIPANLRVVMRSFSRISDSAWPSLCQVELLIDGDRTFDQIFAAIGAARSFVLIQYYILRSDRLGLILKKLLIRKAREGVRIYVLYDGFGSFWLSAHYIRDLKAAKIRVARFHPVTNFKKINHINFRNHRKLVLVDGSCAFTGGLNVGDEYVGGGRRARRQPYWRDTHLKVIGPCVQDMQREFTRDWTFTTGKRPKLEPNPLPLPELATGCQTAIAQAVATGPRDRRFSGHLFFLELINAARDRLWLATPYFVPDQSLMLALELAHIRGVDVRILIPMKPDHAFTHWATMWFATRLAKTGVHFFLYAPGFMHQKVALVDRSLGMVGSSNLDERALNLNFETNVVVTDEGFNATLAQMLEQDFRNSVLFNPKRHVTKDAISAFKGSLARFFAPLL